MGMLSGCLKWVYALNGFGFKISVMCGISTRTFHGSSLSPRVLFWTDHTNIRMQTLSGVELGICHTPLGEASSLAVDVQNTKLFWLSSYMREPLTISQMDYTSTTCIPER